MMWHAAGQTNSLKGYFGTARRILCLLALAFAPPLHAQTAHPVQPVALPTSPAPIAPATSMPPPPLVAPAAKTIEQIFDESAKIHDDTLSTVKWVGVAIIGFGSFIVIVVGSVLGYFEIKTQKDHIKRLENIEKDVEKKAKETIEKFDKSKEEIEKAKEAMLESIDSYSAKSARSNVNSYISSTDFRDLMAELTNRSSGNGNASCSDYGTPQNNSFTPPDLTPLSGGDDSNQQGSVENPNKNDVPAA